MSKNDNMPTTSLPKKWNKLIEAMPEFKEEADMASVEDLKKIVVQSEANLYTIAKEKEEDMKLSGAREVVKDLAAPYKESQATQQVKIMYAMLCLESKGCDLTNTGK